jgi:alcohol dehydrogenase class IV
MFDAPHGAICARLLPFVTEANIAALRAREPKNPALSRYAEIMMLLTERASTNLLSEGLHWLHTLSAQLGIPRLSHCGIKTEHIPVIVEKSAQASSMKANPLVLTAAELTHILEQAL